MNPQDTENHDASKRKFLNTAVKIAYIAPLVMSLPANATYSRNGSNCDNKDGYTKEKVSFKQEDYSFKQEDHKKDDHKKDKFKKDKH